ncbi:hypothetical protein MM221_06440 [Salipaludibacillus sp. LMS25]|jgi:hypothetical protein|uniref:DUF6792 domain-containing protein n=1 Tax=Salipaludibacillus sp. LMS25 TaxID=2924031 RepID=UPI0020D167BE|nr:DUF6792 domain-containing protein [Salipaludibacillus sp. LMS25]UTR16194.1 hypothetical protein MM221_06440 [Salipaludibacillus sp. LMS25]
MAAEKVFITDEIRARVTDLEYRNLPEEEFLKEIERIYIEEMGEDFPAEIGYFHSSEAESLQDDDSGYDGTAIHFYSAENDINEAYPTLKGQ